jgi:hypothetical protein
VDRELTFAIASTFSWEIWTSSDRSNWARAAVIPTAPFGPFDQRFELRFPNVLARYLKVVVRPLAPTVPDAASYPTILVTELEPFSTRPAGEFQSEESSTRNLAQASSRLRILDRPGLFYETTYYRISSDTGPSSWTLSNGLSTQHRFNEVWGVSARVAREDGVDRDRDRTAYVYSAALSVVPLETLRHSLVVSGYTDETGGLHSENHGAFLNTTALVYQGVDLNVLLGKSYNETTEGYSSDSMQIGAGATLVPHRTVTVTLRYDDRDSTISRGTAPDTEDRVQSGELAVAYNPLPSLYLYASRLQEERTAELDRTTDSFAASWSPFPGGALQVSVSYNETHYSDLDESTKAFVPFVRWNVNPRTYLELTYQALRRDSTLLRQDHDILMATLRVGF